MKKQTLITLLTLSAATSAFADSYVGLNATRTATEQGALDIDSDALIFRMGTKIHDNFSLEARWGAGLDEESIAPATYEMDYLVGAFVNYYVQPEAEYTPYTMLGYTRSKFVGRILSDTASVTEESYSYGIGFEYKIANNGKVNIEYMKDLSTDYTDSQSFALGLSFSF